MRYIDQPRSVVGPENAKPGKSGITTSQASDASPQCTAKRPRPPYGSRPKLITQTARHLSDVSATSARHRGRWLSHADRAGSLGPCGSKQFPPATDAVPNIKRNIW